MTNMKQCAAGLTFALGAAAAEAETAEFRRCLAEMTSALTEAAGWISQNAFSGASGFGWYNLPDSDTNDVIDAAEWLAGYDAIIHVGIGGSSLGNLMLHQALLPMYYNEQEPEKRGPRFYLADNPDPDKAQAIWERAGASRVALIGVSKSGATAETMSQFLWLRDRMKAQNTDADRDILVITDPKDGVFRKFTAATGCRSLEIPPTVGGRFSVLSPSGLVTAAALGADIKSLLAGAAEMKATLAEHDTPEANPALYLAALHRFHEKKGRPMAVMMPYASRLETFAEWFAQLWGESVGKDGLGTTPVRALGAVDQHSQVQLYTAGPDDKLYTLIEVAARPADIILPQVNDESLASLSYLAGQKLGTMLNYEAKSTAAALIKAERPVVWLGLDKLDAKTLGALVFFYEYLTAVTGRIMNVNPFDQPGVEQGKKYTYGMMGRDSFAEDADEANAYFNRTGA